MLDSWYLISLSVLKNIFEYYPTLDSFFMWYRHFEICVWFFVWFYVIIYYFLKFVYACQSFLFNLDFVEPLGVFAAICPLNECFGLQYVDLDM